MNDKANKASFDLFHKKSLNTTPLY